MVTMRFLSSQLHVLRTSLLRRADVESGAVVLARQLDTTTHSVYVVEEVHPLPEDAYQVRRIDRLEINPGALVRLTRPARLKGYSVFTLHTHPMAEACWFSMADDAGDRVLMPSLHTQMPGRLHGSLVMISSGEVCARAFDRAHSEHAIRVMSVGKQVQRVDAVDTPPDELLARQRLALGKHGQAQLGQLRVGVVGLGGTGSVVSGLLAHLGVGEIVAFDVDIIEAHNVGRGLGARASDAGTNSKANVAGRYAAEVGGRTKYRAVQAAVGGESELRVLRECDVVMSCVDSETPRALLNQMAYRAAVPVIDMGTAFRVDDSGVITGDAGRIVIVGPGRPCLACWGDLNPDVLREEAMSDTELEAVRAAGYLLGTHEPQPAVMSFNMTVSAMAVTELLRLVTGFAGADEPPDRLACSFSHGTVRRNRVDGRANCRICGKGA